MAKRELLLEDEAEELESDVTAAADDAAGSEIEAEVEDTTGPAPADWEEYRDHHLGAVIDNQIMGDKEAQDAAFDQYVTVKTQRKLNPEQVAPPVAVASDDESEGSEEESEDGED